jgi:Tol biopolymer transport system component
LPAGELLRLGTQIADALDRAHRAGVIHRDLKPANVMITRSGAKLMDFGLSRVTAPAASGSSSAGTLPGLSQSPTMAQALTTEGSLLGTFQYMAPEQLEGREADARSDIWALGCVLYEMATGRRAFDGRSQASLIAAILEREPASIGEMPSGASQTSASGSAPPAGLERLIRNCLAKDPEDRVQTSHDVKLQLRGIAEGAGISEIASGSGLNAGVPVQRTVRRSSPLPWAIAAAGVLAAIASFAWLYPQAHRPAPMVRFRFSAPAECREIYWPRVAPDGRSILFQGVDSTNTSRAYLQPLDQPLAHAIPGTEGVLRTYWSPDGREIAFVLQDRIVRLPIAGGTPIVIGAAAGGADISWGAKGQILMDGQNTDSLRSVPASGGELKPATRIDRNGGEVGSAWPCFLPDGEHFLFIGTLTGTVNAGNIRLGRLGSLDSKLLGTSDGRVEYAPGGWVVYVKSGTLLARKLDLGAGKLTGEPITVVENVRVGTASGHFSFSPTGVFSFASSPGGDRLALAAIDTSGRLLNAPRVLGDVGNPRPSPDGKRLLYEMRTGVSAAGGEIHVIDPARDTDTRLTFTDQHATTPVWAADGQRFAYNRFANGRPTLMLASADGLGAQDSIPLPASSGFQLFQWCADGNRLLGWGGDFHTYAVPISGASRSPALVGDPGQLAGQGQLSPDGRWLAYTSGQSPNVQIYVQSVVGAPGRWQISTTFGFHAEWIRGGRALVYENWQQQLMIVDVDTRDGFRAGNPRVLFTLPSASAGRSYKSWGAEDSGQRFWVVVPPPRTASSMIDVVTDFGALVGHK